MDIDFDTEMVGTVEVTEKDALDLAALTTCDTTALTRWLKSTGAMLTAERPRREKASSPPASP